MNKSNIWKYVLAIESDLAKCTNYVEISEDNYPTYSNEFAKIIMTACAEIDSICKLICLADLPKTKHKKHLNINHYHKVITKKFPGISNVSVTVRDTDISITPWSEWIADADRPSPNWWQNYNDIKHNRSEMFTKANLDTAIHSVSALVVLSLYYFATQNNGQEVQIDLHDIPILLDNVFVQSSKIDKADYSPGTIGGLFWGYNLDMPSHKN